MSEQSIGLLALLYFFTTPNDIAPIKMESSGQKESLSQNSTIKSSSYIIHPYN